MSAWALLDQFLQTDPIDVGCEQALQVLHVYADLVASGQDPAEQFAGVTVHLAACGPCGADFYGLLLAVTGSVT